MRWMGVVVFGCLAGSVFSAPPLTDYGETIGLMHPVSIEYFRFMRRSRLKIEYAVNGSEKRDITPDMLFHGKDR